MSLNEDLTKTKKKQKELIVDAGKHLRMLQSTVVGTGLTGGLTFVDFTKPRLVQSVQRMRDHLELIKTRPRNVAWRGLCGDGFKLTPRYVNRHFDRFTTVCSKRTVSAKNGSSVEHKSTIQSHVFQSHSQLRFLSTVLIFYSTGCRLKAMIFVVR